MIGMICEFGWGRGFVDMWTALLYMRLGIGETWGCVMTWFI